MATIFSTDRRIRRAGWAAGVFFHLVIAIVIGLATFGMVMAGALTLALLVRPAVGQTAPEAEADDSGTKSDLPLPDQLEDKAEPVTTEVTADADTIERLVPDVKVGRP